MLKLGTDCFGFCESLTNFSIPSSVDTIEFRVFSGCTSLKAISIPEGMSSLGTHIFDGCSGLISVEKSESSCRFAKEDIR